MVPSPSALLTFITLQFTVCDVLPKENEIMFNTKKCMYVLLKCMKAVNVPIMILNNGELKWVAEQKYGGM